MNEKLITPFFIGDVKVNNRLVLAPMAGYTDCAMRTLCARFGAGLTDGNGQRKRVAVLRR